MKFNVISYEGIIRFLITCRKCIRDERNTMFNSSNRSTRVSQSHLYPLIKTKESVTTLNDDVKSLCYEINVGLPFIVQSTSVIDEAKKVKGFFCNGENYHIKFARYFYFFFFFVLKFYFCTTYILGSRVHLRWVVCLAKERAYNNASDCPEYMLIDKAK